MHKDFLVAKSKFFAAACSQRWSKGNGTIHLPEVSPDLFRVYLGWVYSHTVECDHAMADDDWAHINEQAKFCELYLLADALDDIKLRNKTMEIMVTQARGLPHPHTLMRVYERTPCSSLIREMLVDRAVLRLRRDDFARYIAEYPAEFVQEVAMQLMGRESIASRDKFTARLPFYMEPVPDIA